MYIEINGCRIEANDAEMLTAPGAPEVVYMIDEVDSIYLTPEYAMDYAAGLADDWTGDLCVSEYLNNLRYDDDSGEYYLADDGRAILEFTGRLWTYKNGEWEETNT